MIKRLGVGRTLGIRPQRLTVVVLITVAACIALPGNAPAGQVSTDKLTQTSRQPESPPLLLAAKHKKKENRKNKGKRRKGQRKNPQYAQADPQMQVRPNAEKRRSRNESMSIETNPLALVFGLINAELGLKMGNNMTFGPSGSYFGFSDLITGYGIGGAGYYYTNRAFHGFFVRGSVEYTMLDAMFIEATGTAINGIAGYKWTWKNGFTLGVGGGITHYRFEVTVKGFDDDPLFGDWGGSQAALPATGPALMFNIGMVI